MFPRWHAFVRQCADPMQLVLLAVGIGSLYPLKQLGTGLLLILLTLFNAVEGLQQEGKAAAAARVTGVRVLADGGSLSSSLMVQGQAGALVGAPKPGDGREQTSQARVAGEGR